MVHRDAVSIPLNFVDDPFAGLLGLAFVIGRKLDDLGSTNFVLRVELALRFAVVVVIDLAFITRLIIHGLLFGLCVVVSHGDVCE